jgi:HSP20 family protein
MNLVTQDKYDDNFLSVPNLFKDFFNKNQLFPLMTETLPPINIKEDADQYLVMVAIPGIKKEDCKLTVDKGVLNIFSKREQEKKEDKKKYSRYEYNYDSFSHSFLLPQNIKLKSISSKYEDGEIIISLPKEESSNSDSHEIPIL